MNNNLQHSEDFIKNTVGKKTGFSVPKNYFKELEFTIMSSTANEVIPEENKFDIPDGYFSKLEDKILAKVTSEVKQSKVISLKDRFLRFIPVATAASVLLFIGLNYFSNNTVTLDDISSEELTTWLENSTYEISTEELAMVFDVDDFDEETFSDTTLDNSNLEEYLNTIDSETLFEEIQ